MKQILFFFYLLFLCNGFIAAQHVVATVSRNNPLRFTENKGQWNSQLMFRANVPNGKLLIEKNAFYFFMLSENDLAKVHHPGFTHPEMVRGHAFRAEFVGANPNPSVTPHHPFKDYTNFYLGNNHQHWASGVKHFSEVYYTGVYTGIDLKVYANQQQQLKYDWILQPHADASQIKVRYTGAENLRITNKELLINTSVGKVIEQKPYAYQEVNGEQKEVKCKFQLTGNELSFDFPDGYDKTLPLVIDPTIIFSTYTGATADNWGYTATYDQQGNMYLGGYVNADFPNQNTTYPTTVGAFQTVWGGGTGLQGSPIGPGNGNGIAFACDMGISKFSADGSQLLFSTYLGGNDNETPNSLVVDAQNNLIVYGVSYSANYPISSNAFDNSYNGNGDIVVTKFNASGSALIGSTYVGGSGSDGINFDPQEFTSGDLKRNYGDQNRGEVNIDDQINIYVASCTQSANFPATGGAVQTTFGGVQDACAFKLNSDCSALLWSTYLGGSNADAAYSLDIGPNGTLYVAGGTMSSNFPTVTGALHATYQGGQYDGFIAWINAAGTQLLSSSYIGTSGNDQIYFVKIDASANVYFVGQTDGNYPVQNAAYSNPNSGQFITKINPWLNGIFYSTVFGSGIGEPNISPTAFVVDTCENVYVAGWGTNSGSFPNFPNNMFNMPLTPDAMQTNTDGTDFYFFVLAKNAQNILYGSYFGGNGSIEHVDGGTSRFDKRGVIYQAMCAGCGGNSLTPTTPGVWSPTNLSSNCNELGLKIAFNLGAAEVAINASPRATGCVPLTVQFQATLNNVQSYTWYFGDGTTSPVMNPIHTYTDTGNYRVMLVGIDSNSCNIADTAFLDVEVRDDSIVADFLPFVEVDCYNNSVSLHSISYPSASYAWNMGDGTTYHTDSVSHTYANSGAYNVTLMVTDSTRCDLIKTFASQVVIPQKVDASFTTNSNGGCIPLLVNFNAPFSATSTYYWNFGDGATASQASASHTYITVGNFPVSLLVVDSNSCNIADTAYATITTIDSSADALIHFTRTFFGCDSVRVTAWSTYQGEDSETWDWGDGSPGSNADSATHVYTTAGLFTITHIITDNEMLCKPTDTAKIVISLIPLNASITVADTGGCLPFTASLSASSGLLTSNYYWFFGDGDSLSGSVVSHTYNQTGTYPIILVVVDTNACVGADSAFAQITVIDDSAHADFNLNILNDCDSNLIVDLQNTSTNAIQYLWDFGDGTTSVLQNENHAYHIPGTYTIALIATDTNRCHQVDTIVKPVTLLPNALADFAAANVCAGTPVQFTNSSNPHANFLWNFGDGQTSTLFSPTHLFSAVGTYLVQLTVIDSGTCDITAVDSQSIHVYTQPVAGFTTSADTFRFEEAVQFVNQSFSYQNLLWQFGDGEISNEENPVHTYEKIENMQVCLKAYNDACADTVCKSIYISFKGLVGVPNAFSPNGDGINDVVKIEGRGITALTFRIYNRWGEKVFETHDKNIGWNGIYKGVLQEMDVYTYAAEATLINGETIPLKGNITLLR